MEKERLERVKAWNEFKATFEKMCAEIQILQENITNGRIYHSSDFDSEKNSQLVIAFIETHYNVYRNKSSGLTVETQWGCRLIYQLEHNGSVLVKIKDYNNEDIIIKTYISASKIRVLDIKRHSEKFFLVDENTNKSSLPSFFSKVKYNFLKSTSNKSWESIAKAIFAQIPIIKQIIKAFENETKKP